MNEQPVSKEQENNTVADILQEVGSIVLKEHATEDTVVLQLVMTRAPEPPFTMTTINLKNLGMIKTMLCLALEEVMRKMNETKSPKEGKNDE